MSFGYPNLLLLLVVPLLLVIWEVTRRGRRIVVPLDHGHHGSGKWWGRIVLLANLIPAVLLSIAILIASRPLRPAPPRNEHQLTNIEFLLDVSGSMTSQFGEGTRYDAAMRAIEGFTRQRQGDAFGLTIFGNEVMRWTPLTKDLSAIRNATPFLQPDDLPTQFGGTEIGKAVRFSHKTLRDRGPGDSMIVLVSDGDSADLHGLTARQIGAELAQDGIVLYSIHVGDEIPPAALHELSRPTGGRVFASDNPQSLVEVFRHIDTMQPVKLKPAAAGLVDGFTPLAIAGLIFGGIYLMTLFGLRYTPW